MAKKSKLNLSPLNLGKETIGQRLARLRKEKGYTQAELAEKIGITQKLISDYELGRLRAYHEMVARFALALEVPADELLGLKPSKSEGNQTGLKFLKRLKKIEDLPQSQQKFLLRVIDSHLKAIEK